MPSIKCGVKNCKFYSESGCRSSEISIDSISACSSSAVSCADETSCKSFSPSGGGSC